MTVTEWPARRPLVSFAGTTSWRETGKFCVPLRHSREMTLLCSPKVTHHHSHVDDVFAARQGAFATGQNARSSFEKHGRGPGPQAGACASASPRAANKVGLRARGADDGKAKRTPPAWMISPPTLARGQNPVPNRVPSVGHSKRAEVGHFCQAPRVSRSFRADRPGTPVLAVFEEVPLFPVGWRLVGSRTTYVAATCLTWINGIV